MDILVRKKRAEKKNLCKLKVMAQLESIKLNLSEYNLMKVFELVKLFQELDDEYGQQILLEEKKNILESSTKIGILCKRGNTYKSWSEFYAVLSDSYLYLYSDPEKVTYASYINLTAGFDFHLSPENEVGVQHSFKLVKRRQSKEVHYFYCSDAQSLLEWSVSLRKILDLHIQLEVNSIYGHNNNDEDENKTNNNQRKDDFENSNNLAPSNNESNTLQSLLTESLNAIVQCSSIELKVYRMQIEKQWINLKLEGLETKFAQRALDFTVEVSLNTFCLQDFIFEYPYRSLYPLLQSVPIIQSTITPTSNSTRNGNNSGRYFQFQSTGQQKREFLRLKFQQIEKHHPMYNNNGSDLIVNISIGEVYANWKPEQIIDIIRFFFRKKIDDNEIKFKQERAKYSTLVEGDLYNLRSRQTASSNYAPNNLTYLKNQLSLKPEQIMNQSTLLKIMIEVSSLNIYLINHYHSRHNLLCSVSAQNVTLNLDIKEYELSVLFSINDILVNYFQRKDLI